MAGGVPGADPKAYEVGRSQDGRDGSWIRYFRSTSPGRTPPDSEAYASLALPAQPWELLDALDKVRLSGDETLSGDRGITMIMRSWSLIWRTGH